MTSPLILKAQSLALGILAKHGDPATVTWPGAGASLVEDDADTSAKVTFFPGRRNTNFVNGQPIVTTDAIMSPVKRNPVGATIKHGANTYAVLSAVAMGSGDNVAAYQLVLK